MARRGFISRRGGGRCFRIFFFLSRIFITFGGRPFPGDNLPTNRYTHDSAVSKTLTGPFETNSTFEFFRINDFSGEGERFSKPPDNLISKTFERLIYPTGVYTNVAFVYFEKSRRKRSRRHVVLPALSTSVFTFSRLSVRRFRPIVRARQCSANFRFASAVPSPYPRKTIAKIARPFFVFYVVLYTDIYIYRYSVGAY